jgi:hypothetical protein
MVGSTGHIEAHASLEGYFDELLKAALASERLALSEAASAYLLQLVTECAHRDALHAGGKPGENGTPALVWLYEAALQAGPAERFNAFRHLGDVALVVSGFFGAHLERSLVDVNYYVHIGGTAYGQAATLSRGVFPEVLGQLSTYFRRLVEVMTRVAEQTTMPVARDVNALYQRWGRNPESVGLQQRMAAQGLIPVKRWAIG